MFTVLNGYFGVVSVNFRLQEKSCVKKGKLTTDVVVKFFGKVFLMPVPVMPTAASSQPAQQRYRREK
jgi:hypothetical protein